MKPNVHVRWAPITKECGPVFGDGYANSITLHQFKGPNTDWHAIATAEDTMRRILSFVPEPHWREVPIQNGDHTALAFEESEILFYDTY